MTTSLRIDAWFIQRVAVGLGVDGGTELQGTGSESCNFMIHV